MKIAIRRVTLAAGSFAAILGFAALAVTAATPTDQPPPSPPSPAAPAPADTGDIPAKFEPDKTIYDFTEREVMIPMRDGVKLFTIIVIPKGATHAPIILDRTPYSAAKFVSRLQSPHMALALPTSYGELAEAGYIIVAQDVRGKYKSEGSYIMNRPLSGPFNPSGVDHATDAYDTIDWLVKNVPESNGKVGTMGTSYDGFTVGRPKPWIRFWRANPSPFPRCTCIASGIKKISMGLLPPTRPLKSKTAAMT